jgi:hypothetical protein
MAIEDSNTCSEENLAMADDLVTIATFRFATEAEAARMLLEGEGIRAFLADAEVINMDWLIASAVGDVKLQVLAQDAERAGRILATVERKRRWRRGEVDSDLTECLSCGARFPEDAVECPVCGWSFDSPERED